MNGFIDSFAYWLADYYLTTTVLLAAVLVAIRCCWQPVKRLAVAKAAIVAMFGLAGLCALPGWSVVSLGWPEAEQVASPPTEVTLPVDRSHAVVATNEVPRKPIALAAEAPVSFVAPPARKYGSLSWPALIKVSYFVGSAGIVLWLLAGALAARRMVRRAQPAPGNLTEILGRIESDRPAAAELLVSDELDVAAALGVLRPRVLLPRQWVGSRSNDELSTVLAHEAAHIRNGDLAWLAASRVLLILQWAQPMYWLLRRSMRLDQEALADVAAAEHSGRQQYAEQLVAWAREISAQPRWMLPAAVGLWESPSQLRRRLALLLDERLTMLRRCSLGWVITTSITTVALAALLSTATFAPLAVADIGDGESDPGALLAPGVRTLSSGTKVEILAIGNNSDWEKPERWWRPDGTPLVTAPFRVGGGSVSPSDDQSVRQFVMRVPGLPTNATVRWHVTNMVGGAYGGEVLLDGRESPPGYYSQVFCISKHQANFGLRVDVAVGDWNTVATTSPKGGGIGLSHHGVIFSRPFTVSAPNLGEGTGVVITHDFVDTDVRAIAVDRDGKQHAASRTSITFTTNVLMQLDFSGLKIGQVDHFEFQTRDFESVQFGELPAQPDLNRSAVEFRQNERRESPRVAPVAMSVAEDEIAGQVVDEAGRPLAGVAVDAWTWHPGNETMTDDQGHFRLTGFDRREPVEVEFTKSGYCPRLFVAQATGVASWQIELNSRTFLEGRVTDPEGKPVAGALLRASRGLFKNPHVSIGEVWSETNTDADGKYRIYLEPDTYDVQMRVPGAGLTRHEGTVLRDGDQKQLDIRLRRGPTFRAVVRDSATSEPVEGIRLWSWVRPGIEGVSNADGLLEIENMLPGKFEFNVSAVGETSKFADVAGDYARWWSPDALKQWQQLELDVGRDQPQQNFGFQRNFDDLEFDIHEAMGLVTIVVERCVRVRGLVVDPDGRPVAGATVAPAKTGSGNSLTGDTRYSVRTAADGTFAMRLPASGAAKYNLVAHDGDYEEWRNWANGIGELMQTKPGDMVENVKLQLSKPCVVRGRVQDANGQPVAKHRVHAQSADKRENRYYDPTTETNERGEFELQFVRPGEHYIQAEPFWLTVEDGPKDAWKLVVAQPDQPTEGVTLTMPPVTAESGGKFQMRAILAPQVEVE
jgi:beta-lactamase regulating signal transducer with metallopeptidase domain/protocatechuate 3,4-dioxygenase beta subunit